MLIATHNTVYRLEGVADGPVVLIRFSEAVAALAEGQAVAVIALADGRLSVVDAAGPHTSDSGIDQPISAVLILRERPLELLIGAEGARLFRWRGGQISPITAFDRLEGRSLWHTPWGGPPAVRSLAATGDGTVYADIHVGGLTRSRDDGRTWLSLKPADDFDIHQVATSPADDERVVINTARGPMLSDDRGGTWRELGGPLGNRYGRAVALCGDEPDLMLASVSDGPYGDNVHGQLFRSDDAGRGWQHLADGFPAATRRNINTFHVAFGPGGQAWAAVNSHLYLGERRATAWREIWHASEDITLLSACPLAGPSQTPAGASG